MLDDAARLAARSEAFFGRHGFGGRGSSHLPMQRPAREDPVEVMMAGGPAKAVTPPLTSRDIGASVKVVRLL